MIKNKFKRLKERIYESRNRNILEINENDKNIPNIQKVYKEYPQTELAAKNSHTRNNLYIKNWKRELKKVENNLIKE